MLKYLLVSKENKMSQLKFNSIYLLLITLLISFFGCGDSEDEEDLASSVSKAAYIINGSAQTISVFNIETSEMKNDVLNVGKWPADIKIFGEKAYITNTGDNNIQIIDLSNMSQIGTIDTGNNTGPEKIGFISESKAYVSCLNTNSVKAVDLLTRQVTKDIPVGVGPMGLAVLNKKVYVCNTAYDFATNSYGKGTVSVIDSTTEKVIKEIEVPTNPIEATIYGNNVIILCNGNYKDITGKLCIIDSSSDSIIKTVDLETTPSGVAVSSKGVAYITTYAGLISVDIKAGIMLRSFSNPLSDFTGGSGLAFSSDGKCYICVPDWGGTGNDKLLIMDPSEKLIGTYKAGGGASIIAIKE